MVITIVGVIYSDSSSSINGSGGSKNYSISKYSDISTSSIDIRIIGILNSSDRNISRPSAIRGSIDAITISGSTSISSFKGNSCITSRKNKSSSNSNSI